MSVGGSVESVGIDGREFPVAADAEVNMQLGGFNKEVQANGDGTSREIMTRTPWQLDGVTLSVDHDRGDLQYLQEVADSKELATIVITYASGHSYQGRGTITGEVQMSSQNATAPITLGGPGKLTQQ
ncbi:MAG: hypothetical protein ACOC9T_00540 [Myxococcota bacterium]